MHTRRTQRAMSSDEANAAGDKEERGSTRADEMGALMQMLREMQGQMQTQQKQLNEIVANAAAARAPGASAAAARAPEETGGYREVAAGTRRAAGHGDPAQGRQQQGSARESWLA